MNPWTFKWLTEVGPIVIQPGLPTTPPLLRGYTHAMTTGTRKLFSKKPVSKKPARLGGPEYQATVAKRRARLALAEGVLDPNRR